MFGVSPFQMMVVLIVVLLLFGSRLPSTMRSLGLSINSFKKGLKEGEEEENDSRDEKGADA